MDEFNTLGIGSRTVICHLLTVWPTANAVVPMLSICERRRICHSSLIHVKKCIVDLYHPGSPLSRRRNPGILKHDLSLIV